MKTLKFRPELVKKIISGEKTSTWRIFDDKNLTIGDELTFINKETLEIFGYAKITSLYEKTLGTLSDDDWKGHERFSSEEEMYETYRKYYGEGVNKNTKVKILTFDFKEQV